LRPQEIPHTAILIDESAFVIVFRIESRAYDYIALNEGNG